MKITTVLLLPLSAALAPLLGCASTPEGSLPTPDGSLSTPMDEHSYARPEEVRVTHVALDLDLDFERSVATGTATLSLERTDSTKPVVLDINGLEIEGVTGSGGGAREWSLQPARDGFGSAMTVQLAPGDQAITIAYATTAESAAVQWLGPEQTAGGQRPFLFTQGQAILTRTWIPLQDSPGVRVTYEARITAPAGLTPVMSAEQLGQGADGAWRFRMPQPIPPYLIALACGELEFLPISDRCGVWAEPSIVQAGRAELEDTEAMVQAAERLFGPYRWDRFDVIFLPPSFPYGGMENPRLTFATPTILAGDKSLVALIAHELAHSWSGNLVTNATWRDFWLNEGFTTYLENRIMEAVYGEERADMELAVELDGLRREMADMQPADTVLHVDLAGRHPDDGFSGVPYTKGASFLKRMEEVFGREEFDRWLNAYFDEHAFQSITTADFERYLQDNLFARDPAAADQIDVVAWVEEPGLPSDVPDPASVPLDRVDAAITRWAAGAPPSELSTDGWVTFQWLYFLEELADQLDARKMAELDQAFGFTDTGNNEILCVWLRLSVRYGYAAADARLERFLMDVGRRKFLSPLYTEMAKTDAGRERALEIYARARPRYHAVSTGSLDKILGWGG